jgi:hypothetical protein
MLFVCRRVAFLSPILRELSPAVGTFFVLGTCGQINRTYASKNVVGIVKV